MACLNSFDKIHQFNDDSDHSVSEVGEISEGPSEPISLSLGKLISVSVAYCLDNCVNLLNYSLLGDKNVFKYFM
jgi:hypothetical protein